MTKQTLWLAGLLLTLLTASGAPAQAPSDVLPDMEAGGMPPADVTPEPAAVEGIAPEHIHVLLLGGVNKDPEEKQNKDRAVIRMRRFFTDTVGVPASNLRVLADRASFVSTPDDDATREALGSALSKLAKRVGPEDRFVFFYTGQANIAGGELRINLPGPDVTHEELGAWLDRIDAGESLVILDCPQAGFAIKRLTSPTRIVICAARSDQPYATRFSDFFVPALTDPAEYSPVWFYVGA